MEKAKKLKPSELTQINLNHEKLAAQSLRSSMLEKDIKILEMKQEIYKNQIALLGSEIERLSQQLVAEKGKKRVIEEENRQYMSKIKKSYKIKNTFGFDPDSGEIKEN